MPERLASLRHSFCDSNHRKDGCFVVDQKARTGLWNAYRSWSI